MSKLLQRVTFTAILISAAGIASAVPFDLDSLENCNLKDATHGIITTSDVTGNIGGASDCWGTQDGNAPGPSGDGFETEGMLFEYLAKDDGALDDPTNIGLVLAGLSGLSGTWAFTNGALGSDFLIVLKAANTPGYAVWLFGGDDNPSTSGDWFVAWGHGLSGLSVYVKDNDGDIPEPGTLALLGVGLLGAGWIRRRSL